MSKRAAKPRQQRVSKGEDAAAVAEESQGASPVEAPTPTEAPEEAPADESADVMVAVAEGEAIEGDGTGEALPEADPENPDEEREAPAVDAPKDEEKPKQRRQSKPKRPDVGPDARECPHCEAPRASVALPSGEWVVQYHCGLAVSKRDGQIRPCREA